MTAASARWQQSRGFDLQSICITPVWIGPQKTITPLVSRVMMHLSKWWFVSCALLTVAAIEAPARESDAAAASAINVRDDDPVVRRQMASRSLIEKTFKPVVDSLGIDDAKKAKILAILAERAEAMRDMEEVARNTKGVTASERRAAKAAVTSRSKGELRKITRGSDYTKLEAMIESEFELNRIANGYDQMFERAGLPLTADQRLSLAIAMRETYDSTANPAARDRERLPLNAWGLTELDEQFLERLEAFLSIDQRALMRNAIILTNR